MSIAKEKPMHEVPWQDGARSMDACEYLFATELREIQELTLQLIVKEAKAQAPFTADEVSGPLGFLKLGGSPIEVDETCRMFQLRFDRNSMISYTVTNESYGKYPEPPEEFTGKLFRIFLRSHLLDYIKLTSYASDDHPGPGPLMHIEVVCLNHVIDVICTAPPQMWVG